MPPRALRLRPQPAPLRVSPALSVIRVHESGRALVCRLEVFQSPFRVLSVFHHIFEGVAVLAAQVRQPRTALGDGGEALRIVLPGLYDDAELGS